MAGDSLRRDAQRIGDLLVAQTPRDQSKNLALARREVGRVISDGPIGQTRGNRLGESAIGPAHLHTLNAQQEADLECLNS
jgi:hypothetical protein